MTCSWTARGAALDAAIAMIAAAASMLALSAPAPALAQAWPGKTVRIIVPFSPGSATDLLPRAIFEHVSAKVGQTFIVENRPGGGGGIGVSAVAKADPDGHTLLVHSNALVTAPAIREGKLLALAVSSTNRASALPDVPTTVEAGFPDSEFDFWIGLMAPKKTPRDVIARIHQETVKGLEDPGVKDKLGKLAVEPLIMTPEAFDARIAKEAPLAHTLAKAAGIAVKQP